jgi:hypothetical protein
MAMEYPVAEEIDSEVVGNHRVKANAMLTL